MLMAPASYSSINFQRRRSTSSAILQSPAPTGLTYRHEALHFVAYCHRDIFLPRRRQTANDSVPMRDVGDVRTVFESFGNDPRPCFSDVHLRSPCFSVITKSSYRATRASARRERGTACGGSQSMAANSSMSRRGTRRTEIGQQVLLQEMSVRNTILN